jgi:hypothetical protein
MIDDFERDAIKRLREFESDHDPDGWPAIQMQDITLLLNIIEREQEILVDKKSMLRQLRSEMISLKDTVREQRTYF